MRWQLALFLSCLTPACGDSGPFDGGTDDAASDDAGSDDGSVTKPRDLSGTHPPADFKGGPPPTDQATMPPDLAVAVIPNTTAVTVYVEPDDGLTPVTDAIRKASTSIDVEMYYFTDHTLLGALTSAQNRGVTVRVILNKGAMTSNGAAYSQLMSGGVSVTYSNPAFTYTHEKGMIIDGHTLWAMTMNFTNSASIGNREYLLVDTDPADVAEAEAVFNADWNRTTPSSVQRLVVSPINARARIDQMISSATTSLDVEWEELSDQDIAVHLQSRAQAGVKVRIVVPSTVAGTSTEILLKALKQNGSVEIRTISSPIMHAKLVLVDRARGYIGSENASFTSLSSNRELGVLWENAQVAQRTSAAFESDFANASPF